MSYEKPWVGIDLDRTLAFFEEWKGPRHIGEPIPKTVLLVKQILADGYRVKIFTARVSPMALRLNKVTEAEVAGYIQDWTEKHLGLRLEVTCVKDLACHLIFDDIAFHVEPNKGPVVC